MKTELARSLSLLDSIAIVIGVVIGGGIFLVPNLIARSLPSATSILGVWVFAGVVSFFGALACAELGAALPATGGQYAFLREEYGPLGGFLCGWSMFLVARTAQVAWLAVTMTLYVSYFVPLSAPLAKLLGLAIIALFTVINYCGVTAGALVQKAFTLAKVAGLAILIGGAFLLPHASAPPSPALTVPFSLGSFGVALIACLLAYDGWVQMTFVAGEIRDPKRNILLALSIGVAACILLYVLANFAYLRVLTIPEIAASDHVGATMAERILGPWGGKLVSLIIMLSIAGALNGCFLTTPRIYFAQARDGLFFKAFGEVHPRFGTPAYAIAAQALWAAILLISGSYEWLMDYAMFAIWLSYAAMVAGVIVLRRQRPHLPRPYRMWGYPYTALIFVSIAVLFLVNTLLNRPLPSLIGLALIAAGIPVYYLFVRRGPRPAARPPAGSPR